MPVNILCVGGGPAGLHFALLHKKAHPDHRVIVIEQNPPNATYGWGVVFSDKALSFLSGGDAPFMADLLARLESWDDLTVVHQDVVVPIDGYGFSSLARLDLLQLLHAHCERAGVDLRFGTRLESVVPSDYDLVVAADGVNSVTREQFAEHFEPASTLLTNKYIWYGTTRVFDTLSLIFREFQGNYFVAHTYRFSSEASTFIVECEAAVWEAAGFSEMGDAECRAYCERIFAADLCGHRLLSNRSLWSHFRVVVNGHWRYRNVVLLGDALRSVHFSIGSGTRLALEDAIALHQAVEATRSVPEALEAFERGRRPIVDKILRAAANSYEWYERFGERMALAPLEFAMNYVTRSGRVNRDVLAQTSPKFLARYESRSS